MKKLFVVLLMLTLPFCNVFSQSKSDKGIWKFYGIGLFSEKIKGSFSNSATSDSDAFIEVAINKKDKIFLNLYEYRDDNKVKTYGKIDYIIYVKHQSYNEIKISGTNNGTRIVLNNSNSKKLHDMFLKGGRVSFRIYQSGARINNYSFTIRNTDGYPDLYQKMKEY